MRSRAIVSRPCFKSCKDGHIAPGCKYPPAGANAVAINSVEVQDGHAYVHVGMMGLGDPEVSKTKKSNAR